MSFLEIEYKNNLKKFNDIFKNILRIIYDGTLKNDTPFINKLVEDINKVSKQKISQKQVYLILEGLIKQKKYLDSLATDDIEFNKLDDNTKKKFFDLKGGGTEEEWEPGFFDRLYGWYDDTSVFTKMLDIIDTILDIAGFIPGLGIAIDIAGFLLSAVRLKFVDAFFSLINIIPVVGSFIGTPGKYITKFLRYTKKVKKMQTAVELVTNNVGNDDEEDYEEEEEEKEDYEEEEEEDEDYEEEDEEEDEE